MHEETLSKDTGIVLEKLVDVARPFYLAGGTALALQFGHRISVDLDFFIPELFDVKKLINDLSKVGNLEIEDESDITFNGSLDGVKISFFKYNYPLLFETKDFKGVKLADERDIGAMKIEAISNRGSKKDFVDMYVLSKNVRKTWFLMTTFLVLIVLIGYGFSYYYGNINILYIFLTFALFMNIFSYWNSAKIAIKMSGAVPADLAQYRELHNIVENLSITAGLPKPKVYIINDNAPNAFATGRDKNHSAVAVTTGLLQILEKNELECVIAHELSHIGNRDILLSTVAVVLAGFITILADFFIRSQFFGHRDNDSKGGNILMIVGIILAILAPIFATLIQL